MRSKGNSIILLIFIVMFALQYNLSGQNLIVIHKKFSNKEYALKLGSRVRVSTFDKHQIAGRIIKINDSTLTIKNKALTNEIAIKDIRFLSHKRAAWIDYSVGTFLGITSMLLMITYLGDTSDPDSSGNPSAALVLMAPACFLLFYEKRYDTNKYELIVVKPKTRLNFDSRYE